MEGGKAMSGKMSHQQKQATSGSDGKNSDPLLKCRSLVCDSTGIIIAEMVYRCMICNSVTDSITEARAHYQSNHMEEEDEEQEEEYKFSQSNDSLRYQSPYNSQQSSSAARSPMDQSHGRQSGSSFRNALVPDVSLFEGNSVLPLKFSNHHNNNNNNSINHNNNNHLQHNNNNHLSYKSNHSGPMDQQTPSHVPQGQMSSTSTNGSNTKSGYVNCAVCGVTRFYSCVQRRYGQFTCVTCYRYFRTFLLKPKRYACPTLGSCPLNVRTRCRACWIKGCIAVFSVDSRRQAVIEANLPVRRNTAGVASNSPVKSLLPPPPPLASFAAETNGSNGVVGAGDADGQADEEEDEEEQDDGEQSALSHDSEKESSGYDAMLEPEVSLTEDADGDEDNHVDDDEAVDADEDEGEMDGSSLTEDQMASGDQHHQQSSHQQQQQFQQQQHQRHQMLQQHHASITHQSSPPKLVTTIRPSLVNKLIVTGKKVWSCGKCMTCTAEDCGKCIYCLDRPKFGGPFIKKQRCIKRRCLMKIKNNNKTNTLLLRK